MDPSPDHAHSPGVNDDSLRPATLPEQVKQSGQYLAVRELADGTIVGLGKLLFTTAVYVDMNEHGWARRYCYESGANALEAYEQLQTGDDVPTGWVASRGG